MNVRISAPKSTTNHTFSSISAPQAIFSVFLCLNRIFRPFFNDLNRLFEISQKNVYTTFGAQEYIIYYNLYTKNHTDVSRHRSHKGFWKLSTTNWFAYSAVGGFVYPDGLLKSFRSKRIIKIVLGTVFSVFYFLCRPSGYLRETPVTKRRWRIVRNQDSRQTYNLRDLMPLPVGLVLKTFQYIIRTKLCMGLAKGHFL